MFKKIKQAQQDAVENALIKMKLEIKDFVLNEVKKELNPKIEEIAQKINESWIRHQQKFEKKLQHTLEKQTIHFNKQLKEQGPILEDYCKQTIKEIMKSQGWFIEITKKNENN